MNAASDLRPGQRAVVRAVAGEPAVAQRLGEFGLFEGETIECVGFAPFGDPVEFRIGETRLSLRLAEARCITVEPLP